MENIVEKEGTDADELKSLMDNIMRAAKKECPYEIKVSEDLGRYLVAARDIAAREIIIQEKPLAQGPKDEKDDILLCLGCSSRMERGEGAEYKTPLCSKCFWPICSANCEKALGHAENECRVFSQNHVHYPPTNKNEILYKSVFILRCLMTKRNNLPVWEQLMSMEDHRELRQNTPKCYMKDKKILENFKCYFPSRKIGDENFPFDDSEVVKISGIIDVNSHSVPKKIKGILSSESHIYFKTSLVAHSCCPNSSWRFTGLGHSSGGGCSTSTLTVRSNIPLKKGSMISVCYHNSRLMYGTLRRLIPMEMAGLFVCKCQRCLDPTELGTFLSGIKCSECEEGYLLPLDPVDSFSDWKCNNVECQDVQIDTDVMDIIEDVEDMVDFPNEDYTSITTENAQFLLEFVENYSGRVLHPNHYVLQEVNSRIIKYQQDKSLDRLANPDLMVYIQRCEELLKIADILTPGYCEYRAFLLFHLSKGLLLLGRRRVTEKETWDNQSALIHFMRVLELQEEALQFLKENYSNHQGVKPLEKNVYDTKRFIMRLKVVA